MRTQLVLLLFAATAAAAPPDPAPSRLTGAALVDGRAYELVQSLTDRVGQRMPGTPGAELGVEWAVREMQRIGLKNVHKEPVKLTAWIRGDEAVDLVAPAAQPLHATALGNSVGTPPEGITAEVVEVSSLDEVKALGAKAQGRIVLYNKAMARPVGNFDAYGAVVPMRGVGAVEAAKVGAVAALIRSVGTGSHQLPHTGSTRYDDAVPKIPFAAITAEDAELIHRLLASGDPVKVRIRLGCKVGGEVQTSNVVGEVPGHGKPDEIVILGAHLDSWDLGTGAIDDGAGCAIVMDAARLLALHAPPRRTVRVVLFMNEERGLDGARAYAAQHEKELAKHVAGLEVDAGAGRPLGVAVAGGPPSVTEVKRLTAPLAALRASDVTSSDEGGADLIPLQAAGVPVLGLLQDPTSYFDWHHTAGDTFDKIDRIDLALDVAAVAVVAHGLADLPGRLPPPVAAPKWGQPPPRPAAK